MKKKYANKFKETDLDWILNISDLVDFNHKYSDFVLKNVDPNSQTFDEDVHTAVEIVKDFDKYQPNLKKRDINQYNNLLDLDLVLEPIKAKEKERELAKQVQKIYEDDRFLVVVPLSHVASCKYGSGTKWCTTSSDDSNFKRYTGEDQRLYYIIKKNTSEKTPYYKIAVHFSTNGNQTWWNSQDSPLTTDAIEIFKELNTELYNSIKEDFEKNRRQPSFYIKKTFDIKNALSHILYLGKDQSKIVKIIVDGYENIPDMPGHAIGDMSIHLNDEKIDEYQVFIVWSVKNSNKEWMGDVGFGDFGDEEIKFDFGLEGLGFKFEDKIYTPEKNWKQVTYSILKYTAKFIRENMEFMRFVYNSSKPIWMSSIGYGYKFKENKGLVKKLVDWLDSDKEGTRLDFLTDIGVFEKVQQDGKLKYKRVNGQHLYNPTDLRGQYSSFFASAVLAGILKNIKKGRKYILAKGPNFENFKQGNLKAL